MWDVKEKAGYLFVVSESVLFVTFVKLSQNKADRIARIPQRWLDTMKNEVEPLLQVCVTTKDKIETKGILGIHIHSGHPEVKWTTYFIRKADQNLYGVPSN